MRVDVNQAARRMVVSTFDENGQVLREMVGRVQAAPGMFDVFSHADENGLIVDGMHVPFGRLAEYLPGLPDGSVIRLCGCEAGHGEAIAELARVTGRSVLAADTTVWVDSHGNVFAASEHDEGGRARPAVGPDGTTDGTWKIIRPDGIRIDLGRDQFPLTHVPARDDPLLRLAARRLEQLGFQGEAYGAREPFSELAKVVRAFARGEDAAAVARAPYDGTWDLGGLDAGDRPTEEPQRQRDLNAALRKFADDSFRQFKRLTEVGKSYAEYRSERKSASEESRPRAAADARAEAAMIRSNEQKETPGRLTGVVDRMLVHTIPVDMTWNDAGARNPARVEFPDGRHSYAAILDDLAGYQKGYQEKYIAEGGSGSFHQEYAKAILDLARSSDGEIPPSLETLARKVFSSGAVDGFRSAGDEKWNGDVGIFLRRATSLAVMIGDGRVSLDQGLEYLNVMGPNAAAEIVRKIPTFATGDRLNTEWTHSKTFDGAAANAFNAAFTKIDAEHWGPPKQTPRAAALAADLRAEYPDAFDQSGNPLAGANKIISAYELDQNVAEFRLREREILALYAIGTGRVPHPDTSIGVTDLNTFFYGNDDASAANAASAVRTLAQELWTSLGWGNVATPRGSR